jgi:hypothetical protein
MAAIMRIWRKYADTPEETRTEDAESLLPDDKEFPNRQSHTSRRSSSASKIVLLALSHCLVATFAAFIGSKWRLDPTAFCSHVTSRFCKHPVLNEMRFNLI